MSPLLRHTRTTLALTLAVGALSACVVTPYPGSGVVYEQSGPLDQGYYSTQPAPYPEIIPVSPYYGAVWIGGNWGWSGGRREWVPGRWDRPHNAPRPPHYSQPDRRPGPPPGQFERPDQRPPQPAQPFQPAQPDRRPGPPRDQFTMPAPRPEPAARPPGPREQPREQPRERGRYQVPGQSNDGNPGEGREGGGREGGRDGGGNGRR